MHKVLRYADDVVYILQDPMNSLRTLHLTLTQIGRVSSCKVNEAKSTIMGLNIGPEMWDQIMVCMPNL